MTQDRNYLRMMHDRELTRYAQDNVRTELEFVLLERLEQVGDLSDQLEAAQAEIEDLTSSCEYWRLEATDAQDALEALQAQLEAQ
jgi:hypothetical protein